MFRKPGSFDGRGVLSYKRQEKKKKTGQSALVSEGRKEGLSPKELGPGGRKDGTVFPGLSGGGGHGGESNSLSED